MRKSALQPRSRNTPTGGRRIAKLLGTTSEDVEVEKKGGLNVHDLWKIVSGRAQGGGAGEHTLQMSEPVNAIVGMNVWRRESRA